MFENKTQLYKHILFRFNESGCIIDHKQWNIRQKLFLVIFPCVFCCTIRYFKIYVEFAIRFFCIFVNKYYLNLNVHPISLQGLIAFLKCIMGRSSVDINRCKTTWHKYMYLFILSLPLIILSGEETWFLVKDVRKIDKLFNILSRTLIPANTMEENSNLINTNVRKSQYHSLRESRPSLWYKL